MCRGVELCVVSGVRYGRLGYVWWGGIMCGEVGYV